MALLPPFADALTASPDVVSTQTEKANAQTQAPVQAPTPQQPTPKKCRDAW